MTITPGLSKIPVYVKDGEIIPMMPPMLHAPKAGEKVDIEIRHYGEKPGKYLLYDDDGETFDYEKGSFTWRTISVEKVKGTWKGVISAAEDGKPNTVGNVTWKFMSTPAVPLSSLFEKDVIKILQKKILADAALALKQQPVTVTAQTSSRSAGGKHDFFSEGDYWWPNPISIDSPYIQKDGMTNPDNFVAHRHAMILFSRIIGALASAYKITGDDKYVRHALLHCKAWFVDTTTMMNPHLLYAQAIKGRFTGRGIGIIDAIQLMEVTQGLTVMQNSPAMDKAVLVEIKKWFDQFLQWLTTHQNGKDEMNAANNHGTCWVMQVSAFAKFTGNRSLIKFCSDPYKNKEWFDSWKKLDHSPVVDEVIRNLPVRNPLIWLQ